MALRARVEKGLLVLDEPASLPEGAEYELVPIADELDETERAKLFGILTESIRTHLPGTGVPARELLARLRASR